MIKKQQPNLNSLLMGQKPPKFHILQNKMNTTTINIQNLLESPEMDICTEMVYLAWQWFGGAVVLPLFLIKMMPWLLG